MLGWAKDQAHTVLRGVPLPLEEHLQTAKAASVLGFQVAIKMAQFPPLFLSKESEWWVGMQVVTPALLTWLCLKTALQ